MTASPFKFELQLCSTISGRRCVSGAVCSAAQGHGVGLILAALTSLAVSRGQRSAFPFLESGGRSGALTRHRSWRKDGVILERNTLEQIPFRMRSDGDNFSTFQMVQATTPHTRRAMRLERRLHRALLTFCCCDFHNFFVIEIALHQQPIGLTDCVSSDSGYVASACIDRIDDLSILDSRFFDAAD